MRYKKILGFIICAFAFIFLLFPANVMADDATVVFGSDSYENESGAEFPVGVYIDGESSVGFYHVEIMYDPERLEYIGGATSANDGIIIFEGNGDSERVSTMLQFKALSGGDTQLTISEAIVRVYGTNNELFDIVESASVPVTINGEDIVDIEESEQSDSNIETTDSSVQNETAMTEFIDSNSETIDGKGNNFWAFVILLPLAGILATIIVVLSMRKKQRKRKLRREYVKTYTKTKQNNSFKGEKSADTEVSKDIKSDKKELQKPVVENKEKRISEKISTVIPKTEPVIQVKNVGMTFKVSNSNSSGIKDYMIQKVKGNLKYRKMNALENISFDVYKGEVVGIIGTNGSGKSTLLKIVSGALLPTSGEVIADKKKIQLLTLGTGFDGELSAKENVYLNGAIIGYTKEFIDEHYDEIVEFAELKDFMDEKVKNFSSGMVSRLGFSIATVAGVAEILILDEVLSVGDQFFRKKSLERVQQMIHGGSTVLIVSHSLATIKAHCTKVVWIEKGKLRMVGSPADVCDAYENHQNEFKKNEKGELSYYKDGVLQRDFTGLVKNNKGEYLVVKNGIRDLSYDSTKYLGKDLKSFKTGVLNEDFTGITTTEKKNKVYFKDGVFQTGFTGVIKNSDNKYMYFKNGVFNKKFNGEVDGHKIVNGIAEK